MNTIRPGGATLLVLSPGVQVVQAGADALDPDAAIYIAAMSSAPDATRQGVINTFFLALKAAGIYTLLDEAWLLAAHTSQAALLGIKRYKDCVAVNSPTFTADQGFAGNGSSSYLNTQFTPSTHGVNFALNDASFGVYSRTDALLPSGADMGGRGGSNVTTSMLYTKVTGSIVVIGVNQGASATASHALESTGLWVNRRTASNAIQVYRNGASIATASNASTSLTSVAMLIGARMSGASPGEFSTRQLAFAFVGASMSAQQQADLFTAVEAYLDAIGAGVI